MSAQERQYHYLRAELAELNKLLTETPETAVIDRMSLEYRKSQVEAWRIIRRRPGGRRPPISPSTASLWWIGGEFTPTLPVPPWTHLPRLSRP